MTPTLNRTDDDTHHGGRRDIRSTPTTVYDALDDRSLLALMLRRSVTDPDALAGDLLVHFGTLGAVAGADRGELVRVPGVGPAVLADLKLLPELAVRLARSEACRRPVITSWSALVAYVRVAMAHRLREQFRVLYLDRRNTLMCDELLAEGTVDHAPVYPREVVRRALDLSASAMILVHNHPSGDPEPSRADIEMTRKIIDAARLFGLQVHDHLVIGRQGTASFKTLGLI
ncbi:MULTISPECIES: DNA repair protein RadC [Brevundimonas]|uniref:MPN domain-containing protein n=1 Tax=Brevundimonas mediterranea TaxID=74329 RepID=A0A7Z8Y119_9CAUL|nr:DNA repair protein RadC [Brevundimonas mediterranea]VDC48763.1 hypothetical protein BREV_BREV_03299 [Brevundimonas mediterranea]